MFVTTRNGNNKMVTNESSNQNVVDYQKENHRYQKRLQWPKLSTKNRIKKPKSKTSILEENEKEVLPRTLESDKTMEAVDKKDDERDASGSVTSSDDVGGEDSNCSSDDEEKSSSPKKRYPSVKIREGNRQGPLDKGKDGLYHCNDDTCKKSFKPVLTTKTYRYFH